jgi:hypothetical protein
MALAHYNPTSTNEKALQFLTSTNLIEEELINSIYEEFLITREEEDYKILFGENQEIEKIVKETRNSKEKNPRIEKTTN